MPLRDHWWCILVAKYGAFLFTEIGAFVITDYKNEYSNVYWVSVQKRNEVKSAYFNRVRNKLTSIPYPIRHTNYRHLLILVNLSLNNIKGVNFDSYPTVKKRQTQNKKQYANQYN